LIGWLIKTPLQPNKMVNRKRKASTTTSSRKKKKSNEDEVVKENIHQEQGLPTKNQI
jgi:hypothetical protein